MRQALWMKVVVVAFLLLLSDRTSTPAAAELNVIPIGDVPLTGRVRSPDFAFDEMGSMHVACITQEFIAELRPFVQYVERRPNGTWGQPETLTRGWHRVRVAVDSDGVSLSRIR